MREADKAKNRRKYQYTILRCIAQDGTVMEGMSSKYMLTKRFNMNLQPRFMLKNVWVI